MYFKMKFLKSKQVQKAKGRKNGIYHLTLEVTDYDIEMFENLHHTYDPFEKVGEPTAENDWTGKYTVEFTKKYQTWLNKTWRCFWKLWSHYDEY